MSLVLTSTLDMNHNEWLEARKNGIGGSDVSAICGLNKYKSAMGVYLDKIGAVEKEEEQEQSEAAYWGHIHEETVAKEFTKRTGKKVRNRNAILQHKDYPWMLANLDRVVVGEKAILECKTASEYLLKDWDGEEIPEAYILQVQHYLAVTGYEKAYIAVLIGGNKYRYKEIERDNDLIDYLIEIEKDFWLDNVGKKIPPEIDGSDASTEVLKLMYPIAISDEILTLEEDIQDHINNRFELKQQEEDIKRKIAEIDNKIKGLMGANSAAIAGDFKVNWSNTSRSNFDTKTFKEKYPDLYKQYLIESPSRRFSISKAKEIQ